MDIDEQAIRERIEKKFKKRQEWLTHLVIFVIVNIALWVLYFTINFIAGEVIPPWPMIVLFGWGLGLAIHSFVYLTEDRAENAKEAAVQQAIEQARLLAYNDPYDGDREKPKRKPSREIRLSEDGELMYDDALNQRTDQRQNQ